MKISEHFEIIRNSIDTYNQTVTALHVFGRSLIWDKLTKTVKTNAFQVIGKGMKTSDKNKILKDTIVTPDLVAQISLDYGIIGEAKTHISSENKKLVKIYKQLQKYDDSLKGWWTADGMIATQDTVLLTALECAYDIRKYIENLTQNKYSKNLAVIGFFLSSLDSTIMFCLKLEYGKLSDDVISEKLEKVAKVPYADVIAHSNDLKFYDTEPNPVYMIQILWNHYFPNLIDYNNFDDTRKCYPTRVNIPSVTQQLVNIYGQSGGKNGEAEFPKIAWVREAFNYLEVLELAVDLGQDEYEVLYKEFSGDVIKTIAAKIYNLSPTKKSKINQRKLGI